MSALAPRHALVSKLAEQVLVYDNVVLGTATKRGVLTELRQQIACNDALVRQLVASNRALQGIHDRLLGASAQHEAQH